MEENFIDNVKQIILNHLDDEKFGVNELASEIGLSKSQTLRKVKSVSGKSINQFIKETRLQEAAKLIVETDLNASEICYKTGFSSPSYFNKCFKKYYNLTPREYKENPTLKRGKKFTESIGFKKLRIYKYFFLGGFLLALVLFLVKVKQDSNIDNNSKISIAVLYFDDHSPNSDIEWFCNGLTEEIIEKLAGVEKLLVTSRTSVKQFRNSKKSITEIAKSLNVDFILESSVSKSKYNDSIRIITQLINIKDTHVWSNTFDESIENSLRMQNDVSKRIVKQLNIALSPEEEKNIEKYPTENMEAYKLFLKAEYQRSLFNKTAYAKAKPLYEDVIAKDSSFIEAYLGLSQVWQIGGLVWGLYNEQDAWENAKQLLLKARNINANNEELEYYLHLGYFYYDWNFEAMETYYQKRLLMPNYSNNTGVILDFAIKTGRYNEAYLINEGYIKNSPNTSHLYVFKAEILNFLNKKNIAFDILEKKNLLFFDDMYYLRESAKIYFYLGDYEKSKIQLKKIRTHFPNENPSILIWLDAVFAQIGNANNVNLYLNELKNLYEKHESGSPAWFIALYYCYIEDYEKTFIWLENSFNRHEVELTWLREEPLLIPIKEDVRYKDLYTKIGFSKIE